MRAVIQRVRGASVSIDDQSIASIQKGLLILLGITHDDDETDAIWLARKVLQLRIFDDRDGMMNHDIKEHGGDIIVVSQFTLHAKIKKGTRPSYAHAAPSEIALPLYDSFVQLLGNGFSGKVQRGRFGSDMEVSLVNDGPVTIIIDTKKKE